MRLSLYPFVALAMAITTVAGCASDRAPVRPDVPGQPRPTEGGPCGDGTQPRPGEHCP